MDKTSNKNNKNISLTNSAINQFKKILLKEDNNAFVRLFVDSGGCSGFSFKFSVDKEIDSPNWSGTLLINGESIRVQPLLFLL